MLYLVLVVAFVIAMLWLFQIVWLDDFYRYYKTNEVASAATSTEELHNPVHPGTRRKLAEAGIRCEGKRARQMNRSDYNVYDMLIGMEESNMRNMRRMLDGDPDGKLVKLLCLCGETADVSDPWWTGDFDSTYRDVLRGCRALMQLLCEQNGWKLKGDF